MSKKNFLLNMMTIMMVAVLSLGFASCSSDDGDDIKIDSPIVGIWESGIKGLYTATINFRSDATVTLKSSDGDIAVSGTYEVSEGNDCVVKFYWEDGTNEFWEVEISGDTMKSRPITSSSKITWKRK